MRSTGIGTSLILIATGAVLAFAVSFQVTGVSISAVGAILLIVGIVGLVLSLMMQGDLFGVPTSRRSSVIETHDHVVEEPPVYSDTHTHPVR